MDLLSKINLNIKTMWVIFSIGIFSSLYIFLGEYVLTRTQGFILDKNEFVNKNEVLSLLIPLSLFIFLLVGLVIILRSLVKSKTKQLQAKVQEVKEVYNKYLDIIEEADNALFEWIPTQNKLQITTSFLETYVCSSGKLKANNWQLILSRVHLEDYEKLDSLLQVLQSNFDDEKVKFEFRILALDNEYHHLRMVARTVLSENIMQIRGSFTDITIEKRIQERAEKLAYTNQLTGLPNRIKLLESFIEVNKNSIGALFYIDIDNLNVVNNAFGIKYGDVVIKNVAESLKDLMQGKGSIWHVNGDEFILFIENCNELCVQERAEQIFNTIRKEYTFAEVTLNVTASIGVSFYPQHGTEIASLIKCADTALASIKRQGRSGFKIFSEDLLADVQERLLVLSHLRKAILRNELNMHYQAQMNAYGKIVAFEGLMRWKNPILGNISPVVFIPIAEENNLIYELGNYALQESCDFWKYLNTIGYGDIRIAVNISAKQLLDDNFVAMVKSALQKKHVPAKAIEIEITESVFLENKSNAVQKLSELREMGMFISLDDFGTGYSSLTYLKQLPVDTLKIDKSFIDDITKDNTQSNLVNAIIEMAHILGLNVVAEGIEELDQQDRLLESSCDLLQGYYISKPLPTEQAINFLKCGQNC